MVTSKQSLFRRIAAVVFPWLALDTASALTWLLHTLLWAGVLVGLWHLNRTTGVERWLHSPWPMLHHAWLPVLAVLVYLLTVLGVGLWNALSRAASPYAAPDLDATWNEAQQFLDRTCFSAARLPLYLVLGPMTRELKSWLDSIAAASVLARTGTPLHIFANADAIFVICNSASLLARPTSDTSPDETSVERLRHVCELLQRDRPPRQALHGIVLAVPFESLQADAALEQAIARCQHDLQVVRRATGLECPLYVAFTGIHGTLEVAADGWFQRFALTADLDAEEASAAYANGLDHLCTRKLALLARSKMQLDVSPAGGATLTDVLRDNIRQYLFLAAAPNWRARLQRLLTEGTCDVFQEPGVVVGCYFLPTLANDAAPVSQALLTDLLAQRRAVSWTSEMRAELRREERLTHHGYGLVAASWLGMLLAAGWYLVARL